MNLTSRQLQELGKTSSRVREPMIIRDFLENPEFRKRVMARRMRHLLMVEGHVIVVEDEQDDSTEDSGMCQEQVSEVLSIVDVRSGGL